MLFIISMSSYTRSKSCSFHRASFAFRCLARSYTRRSSSCSVRPVVPLRKINGMSLTKLTKVWISLKGLADRRCGIFRTKCKVLFATYFYLSLALCTWGICRLLCICHKLCRRWWIFLSNGLSSCFRSIKCLFGVYLRFSVNYHLSHNGISI